MAAGFSLSSHLIEHLDRDIVEFMFEKMDEAFDHLNKKHGVTFKISDGILNSLCNITLEPFDKVANQVFVALYEKALLKLQAAHISWSSINLPKGHHLLYQADAFIKQTFPHVYQIKDDMGVRFVGKGNLPKLAVEEFRKIVHSQQVHSHSLKRSQRRGDDNGRKSLNSVASSKDERERNKTKEANEEQESRSENERGDECPICLTHFKEKHILPKCRHAFCRSCIDMAVRVRPACPMCNEPYGNTLGNQPINATMTVNKTSDRLPGYRTCGRIEISYTIPHGVQGPEHPQPGKAYRGMSQTAYLPDNQEGNHVLLLLQKAFKQRLTFTVGVSRSTGVDNFVTWNGIEHKTSIYGGPFIYGYPDPDYLKRVQDDLKDKGIV
ncbi:uncharacterized protein LOC116938614 [Petromyzon marinus]|uniref:E3 ubiquitin-protein ligase n=2 Tax=Petromyzon marinus TaxID=7757 RepID=A0AAJ7WLG8_PETMA|nr:probable E3 ubiquitin-protein ligase DTX3 [Petromyzon marinus]